MGSPEACRIALIKRTTGRARPSWLSLEVVGAASRGPARTLALEVYSLSSPVTITALAVAYVLLVLAWQVDQAGVVARTMPATSSRIARTAGSQQSLNLAPCGFGPRLIKAAIPARLLLVKWKYADTEEPAQREGSITGISLELQRL